MALLTIEGSGVAKRVRWWVAMGVVAGVVAVAVWKAGRSRSGLPLSTRTGVVALSAAPTGTDWAPADAHPRVRAAAAGTDPDALARAMQDAGLRRLWVAASPRPMVDPSQPLHERIAAGEVVRGFRGEALTEEGVLYAIDETTWPVSMADRVLARAARLILEGAAPPPIDAFPESLAEPQPVEVLVLLQSGRGPRLWRSARAPSIAEGLVTAAVAARKRWEERAETMGGPLRERLDQLDVHVALLFDDGTFDGRAVSVIDAFVQPSHGVAYEQPARWRYLLPRATHNAESPTSAYRRLFRDNGLPEDSFDRSDLRLYRIRMQTISVDQGSTGSR